MAIVPAGTIFSAIKAGTNVDKRSALINRNTLEYTIEDIASSVGGEVDLSQYLKIVDAASTYQTLSGMSSYLTSANAASTYQPKEIKLIYPTVTELLTVADNGTRYTGLEINAGNATCGTFILAKGNTSTWGSNGCYIMSVNTTAILAGFGSVLNISIDLFGNHESIITINNVYQAGGGFAVWVKNIGPPITDYSNVTVNWKITK